MADSTQNKNKLALFGSWTAACPAELALALLGPWIRNWKSFPLVPESAFGPSNLDFISRRNFIET